MKRLILVLPTILVLSACAGTPPPTPTAVDKASYACSDNQVYAVSIYQDKNDAEILELTLPDGKKATLVNVVAADGAKYAGGVYGWWDKGNSATFSNLDATLECYREQK